MLTLVSSNPVDNQTDIYIDQVISLEFNKEVDNSYATSEFIKLYKLPTPSDYQQIAITVSKDGNTISVTPGVPLSINSTYLVLIRGDHDINDGTPDGIRATDADVAEGNILVNFITGESLSPVAEDPIESTPVEEPSDPNDPIIESPATGVIEILETKPVEDMDYNVTVLPQQEFEFDKEITATDTRVIGITTRSLDPRYMPKIPLQAEQVLVSGDTLISTFTGYIFPSGTTVNTTRPAEYGGVEYVLPYNHEYELKVRKRFVRDTSLTSELKQDYTVQFTSTLKPLYADPYEVREVATGFISDDISDYLITKMIFTNSKYIAQYYGVDYYNDTLVIPADLMDKMHHYAVCRTAYDLLNSPVLNASISGGGNVSKSLGDFSVSYGDDSSNSDSKSGIDSLLDELKTCFEASRSGKAKANYGVKSKGDTYYPGRVTRTRRI